MELKLPEGFATLEPFVHRWAVAGTANRAALRTNSTAAQRQAFFDAAKDLAVPGLDLLDQKSFDQFDASEQRLMNLLLAFTHVAHAIEVQGDDEPRHAACREHMRITRSPADQLVDQPE